MRSGLAKVFVILVAFQSGVVDMGVAQSFSCPFGTEASCLDYGDQVCSSQGMCVDKYAVCFDQYQCDYQGFACQADYDTCLASNDTLLREHNALIDDYNALLDDAKDVERALEIVRECVNLAGSLEEARRCAF